MLPDLFKNSYIRELSIYDHVKEISLLIDQYKIEKNKDNILSSKTVYDHLRNELTDLFLLLKEDITEDEIERREYRFSEKSKENN